jgi:hypothetical protein
MKYVKFTNDDDDDDHDDSDNDNSDRNPLVANASNHRVMVDLEKNGGSLSEEELARGDSVQLMATSPRAGATAMSPGQSFELMKSRVNTKGGGLEDQL